ncbi:alpha-ketoglutarate-dependent dioxygenase AlkB [Sphingomonas pituitosa]|uniref:alpha-ketoglutarate-dependent dioxygenase AlkB n=1 Tax=Sphingomonas pituitosa TaxID=99597 RepID=UPI0008312048|nr:alpha-ketoglutarate-dependent dioxygenase AlkB [Sphingomonas pituitosa]
MAQRQPYLFDPPAPSGLRLGEAFLDAVEESAAIDSIDSDDLSPFRFQGWIGNRRTTSYGWRYDFEQGGFSPAAAMPDWLVPLRDRAEAFARLAPGTLVQALLIHYPPGAGIGWHRDRSVFEEVVGISLGAAATLRLRRRTGPRAFDRAERLLPPRSIYLLSGEVRHGWEHSIAPMAEPRWSITFRALSALGLRQTQNGPEGSPPPGRTG